MSEAISALALTIQERDIVRFYIFPTKLPETALCTQSSASSIHADSEGDCSFQRHTRYKFAACIIKHFSRAQKENEDVSTGTTKTVGV